MDKKLGKRGFTLIELLVVIAIIGILATIVILNVAAAKNKATNAKAYSAMTVAQKSAVMCLTQGGNINLPTPWQSGFSLNDIASSTDNQICYQGDPPAWSTGTVGLPDSTITDVWPDIYAMGLRISIGGVTKTWQYLSASSVRTQGVDSNGQFRFIAYAAAFPTYLIACVNASCGKKQCDNVITCNDSNF